MSLILNSDFIGKYELSLTQYNTDLIDAYIAKYERVYLTQLLGVTLYDLFQAEIAINNPPIEPIYKVIYDPLQFDDNHEIRTSDGMKEMLLGMIYSTYTLDNQQMQTPNGVASNKNENATHLNINAITASRFNEGVFSYETIQRYIRLNISDYPTFNGQDQLLEYFL
jgi:hypothetical protein